MKQLREFRMSWTQLALIAAVSVGACVTILIGGGGRSNAQIAALAALHNPGTVTVAEQSPSTSPSGGGGGAGGDSGGGGGGSGGGAPTSNLGTSSGDQSTNQSTTTGDSSGNHHSTPPAPDAGLPKVKHVFEIALSTPDYQTAFGQTADAPYLASLVGKGTLLTNYQSLGAGSELADYIAMVGGQKPNADTSSGCAKLTAFPAHTKVDKAGNAAGSGCIYPQAVPSIAYQAAFNAQEWGAYIEGQGGSCQHVNPGQSQDVAIPGTDPGYDTLHNPFLYFDGLLADGSCSSSDQDLSALPKALAKKAATPSFVFVAPNACADGTPVLQDGGLSAPTGTTTTTTTTTASTTTSVPSTTSTTPTTTGTTGLTAPVSNGVCPAGSTSGIAAEDAFLKTWVPKILGSAAYRDDGVLVIAFAQSGTNPSAKPARTGALVISKYTKRGHRINQSYGPYSLLRSTSDMLNYPSEAQAAKAKSFAKLVLNR